LLVWVRRGYKAIAPTELPKRNETRHDTRGDAGKGRHGDTETRGKGDNGKRRHGDKGKGREGEKETRGKGDMEKECRRGL